jgi:hypothetical protein
MARLQNPSMDTVSSLPSAGNSIWNRRPTTREVFGRTVPSSDGQEYLEREFLERVVLPNGTFKTTNANRLDDLNAATLPYIAQLTERPLKTMDVSISSGVSTLEWHDFLSANGIATEMVGTDLTVHASLVSLTPGLGVLVDRDRNILHLDIFGRGTPPRADGLLGIITGLVRMLFGAAMMIDRRLPPLQGRVREAAKGSLLKCEPVTLLTRGISQRESLRVVEEDLMAEEPPEFRHEFHVVRAANILNRGYFPNKVLVQIALKLKSRLKPNGLLIVCRTAREGSNSGTLFASTARAGLRPVCRLGGGSEIEDLLIGL